MRVLTFLPAGLLAVTLFIALTQPVYAQSTPQPTEISDVYACKTLADSTERLECYDNAVGRLEAAEKSGEVVTVSKKEVEKVERDAFGFNIPSLPGLGKLFKKDKSKKKRAAVTNSTQATANHNRSEFGADDMKTVTLELRKATTFGYKKNRFFFTNGQVWEQVQDERFRVIMSKDGPTQAIISKAALGSFMLQINGSGRTTRVRRVR